MRRGPNVGGGYSPEGYFPPINPPQGGTGVIMGKDVFGAVVLDLSPKKTVVFKVKIDCDALMQGDALEVKVPEGVKAGDMIQFVRK